ncbi:MutH/Sau3AI family endonuclease [Maribacter dokdonensis]|uniref:MutH/Sau3AI family endonuclease n=1 Tax=Maribacter dokdonensis TaxID=320912 RepID=UPI0007199325|nr:MutH/Sau3AI family endonuclease [Maribacter dokdonensis]KSA13840.1 DNA mismatch repair enzyme MutH [Maribacter dokdonensis DSW-8]
MHKQLPYDEKDPISIENYSKGLVNKSLRDLYGNDLENAYSGKGKLGQLVEFLYFGYKPNSNPEPDFPEAGVELKTTPIKKTSKGLVSKERLVFNIIDFEEEYKYTFKESSFWKKNSFLLLLFYLYEKDKIDIDYLFKIARLWRFPLTDLKIIKDDWNTIVTKIKSGKAHEISEGDTLYLGACTKGSTALKSRRTQPFSNEKAQQRAFSLKSKYLNFIIAKSLKGDNNLTKFDDEYLQFLDEDINALNESKPGYGNLFENHESIIKDVNDYKKGQTFEDVIIEKFSKYYGYSEQELKDKFNLNVNLRAKNKSYVFAKAILGISKDKIEEFEKAEIELKTIKLEVTGTLKESMSFAQIKYKEIINEEWEESYWFNKLTKRFLFVIFQKDENKIARLKKVMFWTMPIKDLETAEKFWEHTKDNVRKGDYENFWKLKDHNICHVRPKAVNSKDLMETPQGTFEKKKSYWLNSRFILKQIFND